MDMGDLERSNSDMQQIEVSHGSTSNQTSMYASTTSTSESSRTFCYDIINLMLLFASFVFVILFCYNHIPTVSDYFESKHRKEKITIATFASIFTFFLFVLFVVRCVRRAVGSVCCCVSYETTSYTRQREETGKGAVFHNEDSGEKRNMPTSTRAHSQNANLTLNELHEADLRDIMRILKNFLNYHDADDWSFSSTSQTRASQKGLLLGNSLQDPFQNVGFKFTVKAILVGSPNVGKTSIFHRILYDRFSEYYMATLGADLGHSTLHIYPTEFNNHMMINLQLWDIAGSERFSDLAHLVYKDAIAFIVVCDVTSPYCVSLALPWIRDIKGVAFEPHISLLLNKIDLHQKSITSGNLNADFSSLESYSVSAKTGEHVLERIVEIIARAILHEIEKTLM